MEYTLEGDPNETVSVPFRLYFNDGARTDVTADCTITAELTPAGFSIDQAHGLFISDGSLDAGAEALVLVTATYETEYWEYTTTASVTVIVTRGNNP